MAFLKMIGWILLILFALFVINVIAEVGFGIQFKGLFDVISIFLTGKDYGG